MDHLQDTGKVQLHALLFPCIAHGGELQCSMQEILITVQAIELVFLLVNFQCQMLVGSLQKRSQGASFIFTS